MSLKKFHKIEGQYVQKEKREIVKPTGGIWIKQNNLEKKNEEIIIRAEAAYKENLEFTKVKIWFFDSENNFYKKIDAKKANLIEGSWLVKKPILNMGYQTLNKKTPDLSIPSDLEPKLLPKKFSIISRRKTLLNIQITKLD